MRHCLFFFLLTLLISVDAVAQHQRLVIPEEFNHQSPLLPALPFLFFKETAPGTTLDELLSRSDPLADPRWQRATPNHLPEFYSDDFYWFATQLYNSSQLSQKLIFDLHHSRQEVMDVYILREHDPMESYFIGNLRPYEARPIDYLYFAFPIDIEPDETVTLLIKTKNWPRYIVNLSQVLDPVQFTEQVSWRYSLDLLFIGILLAITLYSIALVVFMRDRYYLYFSLIVVQTIFVFCLYFGIAAKFFWPDTPSLTLHAYSLSMVTFATISLLFIHDYCQLRVSLPRARWLLYITCTVMSLLFVLSLLGENTNFYISIIALLSTVKVTLTLVLSLYMWRKGVNGAPWIALAWLVVFLGTAYLGVVSALNLGGSYHGVAVSQIIFVMILSAAVFSRVTELKNREKIAQADSETKSKFLAQMSHEIRNPMNGVIGMSQLLGQTPLTTEQKKYTDIIHNSASSLLTILNDILDFSKMSAGKLHIEKTPFDLHKLTEDCCQMFQYQLPSDSVTFSYEVATDVPQYINSDPIRIRQIMVNFLSNAFKFTDQGSVKLTISLCADNPMQIKIAVSDTGVGLSQSQEASIFESFQQADESITRKYGGTGLGLAICKQLSELMNGDIGVSSEPGKGSTFWTILEVERATANDISTSTQPTDNSPRQPSLRVLLAEDNEVNRLVAKQFLLHLGHQCDEAENGAEAVNKYASSLTSAQKHYDLILMDVDMPVMDGITATQKIRSLEKSQQQPAAGIIALTAHMLPEYIDRFMEAGMNNHLSKPLQLWDLAKAIDQVLAQQASITP